MEAFRFDEPYGKREILYQQARIYLHAPNAHRKAYLAIDIGPPTRRTCPREGKPPQSRSIFPYKRKKPEDTSGSLEVALDVPPIQFIP